jgi:hypothetical protein
MCTHFTVCVQLFIGSNEASTSTSRKNKATRNLSPARPLKAKKFPSVASTNFRCRDHGYDTHRDRKILWEKVTDIHYHCEPGDEKIADFKFDLDVTDGSLPSPLLVTTYPFEDSNGEVYFGYVVWTRFVGTHEGAKIEKHWLVPVESKTGQQVI